MATATIERYTDNDVALKQSSQLIAAGKIDQAFEKLEPLLHANGQGSPDFVKALHLYAIGQQVRGLYDDAFRNYAVVVSMDPTLASHLKLAIFECLRRLSRVHDEPMLVHYLIKYLISSNTDNDQIEAQVTALLRQRLHRRSGLPARFG